MVGGRIPEVARRSGILLNLVVVLSLTLSPMRAVAAPAQDSGFAATRGSSPEAASAAFAVAEGKLPALARASDPAPTASPAAAPGETVAVTPTLTPPLTPTITPTVTPSPTVTPAPLPAVSLRKRAAPQPVAPGGVVTFTLVASNSGSAPATGLVLSDTLPMGLDYELGSAPGAAYDPEKRLLTWQIPELGMNQALTLTLAAEVTAAAGEELANVAALSAADVPQPVTATATVEVGWLTTQDQALITPREGGVLASADGWIEVQVPPGAVTEPVILSHRALFTDSIGSEYVFSLDMVTLETGEAVTAFLQPATVSVRYTAEIVKALRGRLPRLLIFDPKVGWWVPLDSRVNEKGQRVTGETERTGVLSLTESTDEGAVTGILQPSVLGLQPSLWTGDASFGYPIETPPGPGGFGPAVSLSFSNGAANGMLQQVGNAHKAQAGFPGLGWSLGGLGHISRDNDGEYHLSFAGGSFKLSDPDGDGWWTTDPESFLKIYHPTTAYAPVRWEPVRGGCPSGYFLGQAEVRYRDTDVWTVWAKDGTRFEFGGDPQSNGVPTDLGATPIKWGGWLDCGSTCYPNQGDHTCIGGLHARPYRWNLTEVGDSHANAYHVSYAATMQAISDNTEKCTSLWEVIPGEQYVRDSRPTAITYGAGRLEVDFIAANDRNDAPSGLGLDDTACSNQAVWSDWRLEQVQVRVDDPSLGWQNVRVYELGGHKQEHHWVLDTVAWTGAGGTETTPPYTFAYATKEAGNGVFLSEASNGYGGSAVLSYEDKGDAFPACGRWVVGQRVVADGLGNTAETAYAYQTAAAAGGGCGDEEYEFLGFGTATQTVYELNSSSSVDHEVVTEFHQEDDARKGKEKKVQVKAGDSVLHETQHAWVADGTWARLDETVDSSCGGGVCQSKKTAYYYDLKWQDCGGSGSTQYGNVTRVEEYEGEAAVTPYRTTLTGYCPNTTDWIVDKPAFQNLYEAAIDVNNPDVNHLKASTWYVYSDNQDTPPANWNQPVGSKGELRGVRRILQWTPSWQVIDTRYRHDTFGNVTHQTVYNSYGTDTAWATADARVTITTYDSQGIFPLTVTNPESHQTETKYYGVDGESLDLENGGFPGAVKSVTDANDLTTEYRYDGFGRVVKTKRPGDLGWDDGQVSAIQAYFDGEAPFKVHSKSRDDPGTGAVTYFETWKFYDGLGRLVQTQGEGRNGNEIIVEDSHYNALGLPEKVTVPMYWGIPGGSFAATHWNGSYEGTSTTYDGLGRATRVTNPDGSFTVYRHYVVLDPSDPDFDVARAAVLVRDANGHFARQTFDAFGRLQTVSEFESGTWSDPDGWPESWAGEARTHYAYDVRDNLAGVTDAVGNVTAMAYDLLGRKTDIWDPDMGHWHYTYDAVGNLTGQTDAQNQTLSFGYDNLNRLELKDLPSGTDVHYYYDEDGHGHSVGQRTRMTDASGETQWFYDDTRGRLTEERKTIQGEAFVTGWAYDAAGRVREMTYPAEEPDHPGEVVTTVYNAQGLPQTLTGASPYVDGASYTALGQTELLTLGGAGLDLQVRYDYYSDDQRLKEIWIGASDWPGQRGRFRYEYDSVGNVLEIQDRRWVAGVQQLQVQTFAYDALDRLLSGSTSGAGTWGSYSEGYTYNAIGNLTSKAGVSYTYPASGASSVQPHAVRRVTSSGGISETVQIRAYSTPCNDGVRATMELWVNGAKEKTWLDVAASWTTYAISVTLSGNDQIEVVFPNDCNAGGHDRNLFVDYVVVDGRTIQAEGGAAILDRGSGDAAFDGLDVLAGQQGLFWNGALRFVVGDDAAAACYDQNGNMTWRLRDGVAYEQVWDAENRLASATNHATGETTAFTYDGDGALVRKVVGSLTTLYPSTSLGPSVGNHYEKQGSTVLKYYYFAGQRVAVRKDGVLQYLVGDHLGTTSVVVNADGTLHSEARHLPYGDERWASGTVPTDYRFTGQRLEPLGLYQMGARWYDPYIGRFLSPDSIIPQPGNPQSLNRFAYVYNNPLAHVDITGHLPWRVNYVLWQAAITVASVPGPLTRQPICHGRYDVMLNRRSIEQAAKNGHELIVAAAIAHQASDLKDRPYGSNLVEVMQRAVKPDSSIGIGQLRPSEVANWAPDMVGQNLLDPEVAIRIMAAKIGAADNYILGQAQAYGGISQTDRFMLLSITQNMAKRSRMEDFVDSYFAGKSLNDLLDNDNYREQARLVILHIDWLLLNGWVLPEGVDLDYWRRIAFQGDLFLDD